MVLVIIYLKPYNFLETWKERGIVPRVITYLFDEFERRDDMEYSMYISFMEIYNENAFDLLDRHNIEMNLDEWSKIVFLEDNYGNIHLRNLSVHHPKPKSKQVCPLPAIYLV